ncbi:MAG: hypothetical protein ACRDP7_16955 [Trebonia sp.]
MSEVAERAAEEFLAAAYPDERERERAERWLGLMACQGGGGRILWWEIPGLAPGRAVLLVRRVVLGVAVVLVIGWGSYVGIAMSTTGLVGGYAVVLFAATRWVGAVFFAQFRRTPARPRQPARLRLSAPRAIRPRWPRGRKEAGQLLGGALLLGLGILPALVRQWSVRAAELPGATPAGAYRAERMACLATGLAWAPAGLLLGVLPGLGTSVLFEVVAAHVVLVVAWAALLSGSYPLLKLSELVMSADWEDRVRFLPLLEDAADRGVLLRARSGYEIRDQALQARLLASGKAALRDHAELRARRLARPSVRATLVKHLTRRGRVRVCADFTAGAIAAAAVGIGILIAGHGGVVGHPGGGRAGWLVFPVSAFLGALAGGLAGGVMFWLLFLVASGSETTLSYLPRRSRRARLGLAAVAAATTAALVATEGTILAEIVAFVLPAALVTACGTWAGVLAFRRTRAFRRRWQRAAPDVVAAATIGATLLLLVDHRLLTSLPAAGLLFPAAAWGSFLLWRAMSGSERLAIKAAADLAFALVLGGVLVLLLVWLANVLDMPRAEVAALRGVLDRVGALADLPWWAWTCAWLLLAAASLAFIRWPGRLKTAAKRFERWQAVTVTEITERALTGLHVGLLTIVFVGLAAPPAVTSTLGRRLSAAYEVAFQRELVEQGEVAAYTAIATQLAAQPTSPVLSRLVTSLHDISPPEDRQGASSTETDNARRIGEAQALALGLAAAPSLDPTARAAAAAARMTDQPAEPSDLSGRAADVQHEESEEDDTAKRVEVAGDLAAKVVASLIAVPSLSDNEVVQVVREYLAGLIEDSPLKDTFAAWIERLPGAKSPPGAAAEVVPVPERLEQAATAELSAAFSAAGDDDPVNDPFATDPALTKAQAEDPLDGAVSIINQARYAQDQSGSCAGCSVPGNSDEDLPGEAPPEDHVEDP